MNLFFILKFDGVKSEVIFGLKNTKLFDKIKLSKLLNFKSKFEIS